MSASQANSAIYLTDTPSQIKNKINRFAFSGGGETAELHAKHGGNTDVDVSFQYLYFFLHDDDEIKEIEKNYKAGTLSTAELKKRCIQVLTDVILKVQENRRGIDDGMVKKFMDPNQPKVFKLKSPSNVTASSNQTDESQDIGKLNIQSELMD